MVASISDFWSLLKAWIECIFDSIKVLYSVLQMVILPQQSITQWSIWMPSLVISVLTISLALLVLLRIVGR